MDEKFVKNNDYTLSVIEEEKSENSHIQDIANVFNKFSLTKTFNFLSAQITTVTRDHLYQPRNKESGASAAVSTQTIIQNFNDIQSSKEIELMHAKLVEMGGRPPELSSILPHMPITKAKNSL